jgi:glycosyltransferase involved in cell wall biosynthesis
MARGVPVACADVAALPEVAGDAALLFDPHSQEAVTAAVARLLSDEGLRERLSARGHERVRAYTWARTGAASLAGYRRALADRRARRD